MTGRSTVTTLAAVGCGLLLAAITPHAQSVARDDAAGFEQWTSADLLTRARALAIDNERKQGVTSLGIWGNHRANLERLEGRTDAEVHQTKADLILVTSGQITLTVGGTLADPKPGSTGELRGRSINGGAMKILATGDIAHIPANTSHILDSEGRQSTFIVFKVDQP